jgi:coproporphyrinogen III oxidase-like Fe-S oxidoreductase
MLGLYVHIPFCARLCPYCDFAVSANAKQDFVLDYLAALRLELLKTLRRQSACDGRPLTSIILRRRARDLTFLPLFSMKF